MKTFLYNSGSILSLSKDQAAEVETVEYRGWKGMKNGALLRAAEEHFDVLVTMDNNLPEQQPLKQFNIAVAILRAPSKRLQDLTPLIPKLEQLIADIQPGNTIRLYP